MEPVKDFITDKVIAILVMIGSICGGCVGLMAAGIGGIVGGLGVAGATGTSNQPGSAEAASVAAVGGIITVIGILSVALAIVAFIGAIGMLKTQRKGFTLTMIAYGLLSVLSIVGMASGGGVDPMSIVFILVYLGFAGYCWGRLNGKIGPALPA